MAAAGPVVIIGAGMGGLAAALHLAVHGVEVVVLERAAAPGGKMRQVAVDGHLLDAGPTVLTMPWVLETLLREAGTTLAEALPLRPAEILARHAWSGEERLDLFACPDRSEAAIAAFAGRREADGFRTFLDRARRVYEALEGPFIRGPRPSVLGLVGRIGARGLPDLWRGGPFGTLWQALGDHFRDPRLRQLFGRYATYCGSSPFAAPAILMLVAHVEQAGVWLVEGGMHRLAALMADLAAGRGADLRYGAEVAEIVVAAGRPTGVVLRSGERIAAGAVLVNADPAAVARGHFGRAVAAAVPTMRPRDRSLSAVTWAMAATTHGFPLVRHNVFFSADYPAEFRAIFEGNRLPDDPTVYVCAQDRGADADGEAGVPGAERLLCLVNAPATGDGAPPTPAEIESCERRMFERLARCGLTVRPGPKESIRTGPAEFDRLFPATGGALYGMASHGWRASFDRPGSRTRMPGLYLAGGGTHPGPGVPMAILSGRLAAAAVLQDRPAAARASPRASRRAAMPGGTSTR